MMGSGGGRSAETSGLFALLELLADPKGYKQKLTELTTRQEEIEKQAAKARDHAKQAAADRAAAQKLHDDAEAKLEALAAKEATLHQREGTLAAKAKEHAASVAEHKVSSTEFAKAKA